VEVTTRRVVLFCNPTRSSLRRSGPAEGERWMTGMMIHGPIHTGFPRIFLHDEGKRGRGGLGIAPMASRSPLPLPGSGKRCHFPTPLIGPQWQRLPSSPPPPPSPLPPVPLRLLWQPGPSTRRCTAPPSPPATTTHSGRGPAGRHHPFGMGKGGLISDKGRKNLRPYKGFRLL